MWWTSLVIAIIFCVCATFAIPTQNDIAKTFQVAVHRQDIHSILQSIEQRLRNLDNIYSMNLAPSLEEKLELYQRRLETLDAKIVRLETLMMLNLDKISENISTKNFKDDISKTNLIRKVDAVYEGLSHRLNYLDRKFEASSTRIQNKLDTTIIKIEKMDEGLTHRNEDLEIEISDAIAAIDDLKTSCVTMEENIVNNTNENFEVSFKEQMQLMQNYNDKTVKALQNLYTNTTNDFSKLSNGLENSLEAVNETHHILKSFKLELKRELNEYAVKVADMNSENWKTGGELKLKQTTLETILNSSKLEVQNSLRVLMVQIGKLSNKEQPKADGTKIKILSDKIDSNFEKVFSAQNSFMDSCYRLQMDESQIESKISDILEKLIETFEQKTTIEMKDIKNLEKLIEKHDTHITQTMYQANTNIVTSYEKMIGNHKKFEIDLQKVIDHLNALFSLVEAILVEQHDALSAKNINILLHNMEEITRKITLLNKQSDLVTNSVGEIKAIVENLNSQNSSQIINGWFRNISQIISGLETKVNNAYLYYYLNLNQIQTINENLTRQLNELMNTINPKLITTTLKPIENINQNIDKQIADIFFSTTPTPNTSTIFKNLINMRNNFPIENQATTEDVNVSVNTEENEAEESTDYMDSSTEW